jgi:2-polyprenyl-3-methyl-5-hydroxy-6-metoxy-1,4-benzoquinol methylase
MQKENYYTIASFEAQNWWYRARRDLLDRILSNYETRYSYVLDAGCGVGSNFTILRKYSKNIYGVDISGDALDICSKKSYSSLIKTSVENFRVDIKFDLIVCLDVLEHIGDHVNAVRNLKNLLNKNGILIVSVPAHKFLWNINDVFSHHLRRYTLKDINKVMKMAGVRIIRSSYWNQLLFLPAFIYCRVCKPKKMQNNLELIPGIINGFLYFILKVENYIFVRFNLLMGVSIVSICKNT